MVQPPGNETDRTTVDGLHVDAAWSQDLNAARGLPISGADPGARAGGGWRPDRGAGPSLNLSIQRSPDADAARAAHPGGMDDRPLSPDEHEPESITGSSPAVYDIRLQGELDASWTEWLGGLEVQWGHDGTTILTGPLADQAALHGILARIRDLGIPLIGVARRQLERGEGSSG
jgi:hypothetical protein